MVYALHNKVSISLFGLNLMNVILHKWRVLFWNLIHASQNSWSWLFLTRPLSLHFLVALMLLVLTNICTNIHIILTHFRHRREYTATAPSPVTNSQLTVAIWIVWRGKWEVFRGSHPCTVHEFLEAEFWLVQVPVLTDGHQASRLLLWMWHPVHPPWHPCPGQSCQAKRPGDGYSVRTVVHRMAF